MADGIVQVAPDSTGKKMDTEELTVGANTVQRERVQISGAAAAAIAAIKNAAPTAADYALVARILGDQGALAQRAATLDLLVQLRTAGAEIDPRDVSDRLARQVGQVVGDKAHDALNSGNPLQIGGHASASPPTPVAADGNRTRAWFDRYGRLATFVSPKETWVAYADAVAFASAKHHLTLFNATGSGVIVKVRKIFACNLQTAAITGVVARFDVKKATASSAGTTITPVSMDSTNVALPAGVTVRTNGTVTAATLLYPWITSSEEEIATTPVSKALMQQWMNIVPEGAEVQEHVCRPSNEGISVQQVGTSTVGSFGWILVFTVEPA